MSFIKVRQNGAVTVPAALRRKFAINPGAWYSVSVNDKGEITLSPERCVCPKCGDEVPAVDAVTGLCSYCQLVLTRLVQRGMDVSGALKYMQRRHKTAGS